ncbi:50S ribosomal protein L29 [Stygiolobus caldivivus]|nr:50S ribosomal protein L29 [Stygiolobus caldivivus]
MVLNPKELKDKDTKELLEQLKELQSQLLRLKAESRLGTLKNTASIRNTRKDIARIMTILAEKKRGINKSPSEEKAEAKK